MCPKYVRRTNIRPVKNGHNIDVHEWLKHVTSPSKGTFSFFFIFIISCVFAVICFGRVVWVIHWLIWCFILFFVVVLLNLNSYSSYCYNCMNLYAVIIMMNIWLKHFISLIFCMSLSIRDNVSTLTGVYCCTCLSKTHKVMCSHLWDGCDPPNSQQMSLDVMWIDNKIIHDNTIVKTNTIIKTNTHVCRATLWVSTTGYGNGKTFFQLGLLSVHMLPYSLFPQLHSTFSPSLISNIVISLMICVDIKHHVYLLTLVISRIVTRQNRNNCFMNLYL